MTARAGSACGARTPPGRPVLAVVDANAFWTRRLFAECADRFDVLLLEPREFRAHRGAHGRWRSEPAPRPVAAGCWAQALAMPPGWLGATWPIARRRIAGAIARFAPQGPEVLALVFPHYLALAKDFPDAGLVYYNYDEYTEYWPRDAARVARQEDALVRAADVTVCIAGRRAERLRERVPEHARDIHHLPIGCTPEFLADAIAPAESAPPPELDGLRRPLVGYVGTLGARFDYALLHAVAEGAPHLHFALGGPRPTGGQGDRAWWAAARRCLGHPRIHFLGPIPHPRVGRLLSGFDVLGMWYCDCEFNRNACPAKLWDGLGTGRPIVANDVVPELGRWSEALYLAHDADAFVRQLERALAEDRATQARARLEIARAHTWPRLRRRLGPLLPCARNGRAPGAARAPSA